MPITLPALSRRQFLASTAAAAITAAHSYGEDKSAADPHRFVLMADTHIPSSPDIEARGIKMHDNFVQAVNTILELKARPSNAMILGDCAHLDGKATDYALLVQLLEPLRHAGLPIQLLLGNHDHRERFWEALPPGDEREKSLDAHHVSMIAAPRVNWFLLDSLQQTNKTPGLLGEEQLAWLAASLDEHTDRAALVCVHHQPDEREMPSGLTDTKALLDILIPRKHAKALFFGHTHNWEIKQRDGLHLVNLPPVAYTFAKDKPSGFVEVAVVEDACTLQLHAHDKSHPQHDQVVDLKWRT